MRNLAIAILALTLAAACSATEIEADDDPIASTAPELKVIKKHHECMDNCDYYYGQAKDACLDTACKIKPAPTGPNTNANGCEQCLAEADEDRQDCQDFCHVYFPFAGELGDASGITTTCDGCWSTWEKGLDGCDLAHDICVLWRDWTECIEPWNACYAKVNWRLDGCLAGCGKGIDVPAGPSRL